MSVSPAEVKKLRDKTGAGMLDCKKALVEAEGDLPKAESILKRLGLASAEKRAGRATGEGSVFHAVSEDRVVMLELACETDFVAETDQFKELGKELVQIALQKGVSDPKDSELQEKVKEAIAVLSENMQINQIVSLELTSKELATVYLHNGGKIAALVILDLGKSEEKTNEAIRGLGFDLALHVAAFNPLYLSRDDVPEEYLEEQLKIFKEQSKELKGKPENVIENILKGKINKHLSLICMLDQGFVKEEKKKVQAVIQEVGKEVGISLSLTKILYIAVGDDE